MGNPLNPPRSGERPANQESGLRTPAGYRKIEAYTNGVTLIALEWPQEDDENHNCDALGCSSFSHVKYRVEIPDWQSLQSQPGGASMPHPASPESDADAPKGLPV